MRTLCWGSIDLVSLPLRSYIQCGQVRPERIQHAQELTKCYPLAEYAAAFFLLADCLKDACNIVLNHLHDPQLAIALARVYEPVTPGSPAPGPVLTWLLQERILPLAAETGDRWMATWAFWTLQQKDSAVRALLEPLEKLIIPTAPATAAAADAAEVTTGKTFLMDDPALVVLYALVREKTLQARRGAQAVSPGAEWAFVLNTARVLDRMGCDLLALDLGAFLPSIFLFSSTVCGLTYEGYYSQKLGLPAHGAATCQATDTAAAGRPGIAQDAPPPQQHHRRRPAITTAVLSAVLAGRKWQQQ